MIVKNKKEVIVEVDNIKNIHCDMCKNKLITKRDQPFKMGTLSFAEARLEMDMVDVLKEELSQFCETCSGKIKNFIKSEGGDVPSSYLDYGSGD